MTRVAPETERETVDRLVRHTVFTPVRGAGAVAETVARNQEIELMTQAIHALPDRCRQVMTLRNVYGLPQKEIAAQLGISVRTVEAQMTIGIRRCTEFVRRRCSG